MKDLNLSASCYADHAENKISKLQQAYLRKYQPQRYASQRPQVVPTKRPVFGSRRSAPHGGVQEFWQVPAGELSEEGIAVVMNAFQLGY